MSKKKMPKSLAVTNMKGGVGKTISAVSIASNLSEMGYKTLLVDADWQANASDYLGVKYDCIRNRTTLYDGICKKPGRPLSEIIVETEFENLHIIASSLELSHFNESDQSPFKLKKWMTCKTIYEYDYIIFDTRPELGHLFKNVMSFVSFYAVPIFAEADAISGLKIMFRKLREIQDDFNPELKLVGAIITRFDKKNHTHRRFKEIITEMGDKNGIPILGEIPASNAIASSVDHTTPLPFYRINNRIPAREAYRSLCETLTKKMVVRKGRVPKVPIIDSETVAQSFDDLLKQEELVL